MFRILLVDDEVQEREGIRFLIDRYKLPLLVAEASNGQKALEYLKTAYGEFEYAKRTERKTGGRLAMVKRLFKWYYGTASIRKKLVISYLLLITVPILTLGIYSFSVSKHNMERQTKETIRNNVRLMASDLDTSLKRENDNIKYLSYNVRFRQILKISGGNQVEVARTLNEVVEPIFWYFITSDDNLKGIEIYSPYTQWKVGSFLKPAFGCGEEFWYEYHQKNFATLWTYEMETSLPPEPF